MKKACSIVLIAVVCIIGIFALMNYKNANYTKENSEVDIYKTSEYQEIIKGSYLTYEEKFDKNGNAYLYDDENKKKVKPYGKNLVSVIGYGGGKPELRERSVIQDADFYKIALPGDCIVSLAGYSPFFFRNHRR